MKTKATNDWPEIEWEITGEVLEQDVDERMVVYLAIGEDEDGNKYTGSAYHFDGEFSEIKDVEQD